MADKLAIMAELNRRGKLPPDKAALFNEAVKRGLVPGSSGNIDTQPSGAVPGSRAYADWAATRARSGQTVPQVSPPPPQQAIQSPNLGDAALSTINGITGSIPGLQQGSDALIAGGQTGMDALTGQPMDFGARYNAIQDRRKKIVDKAPLSNIAGALGATVAGTGAIGATKAGAEALGMSGNWLRQLLNSSASTAGYEGLQGLSHGHTGGQLLGDEGIGGLSGLGGSAVGQAVKGVGGKIADTVTAAAQNRLTNAATKNAPSASELKSASSALFDSSTGGTPLQITKPAFQRFMGNVQNAVIKYRPNTLNNPEAVGLLQKFQEVANQLADPTGNVAVDLKDMHILRMGANDVENSASASDQTKTIASNIVRQLDNFVGNLKTGDVAGVGDPKQAGNDLLKAISTWSRANKVGLVENAMKQAETYKSGFENGLKLSFLKIMKTPDFARMTKIEQDAIRLVAKGTTKQNIAEGLGKLGFSLGGSAAHNILGGTAGTGGLTVALTPFLGPAAFPTALATTSAVGAVGRRVAENIGKSGADKAARILATPSIPVARQAPNLLAPAAIPLSLLIRGGGTAVNH